MVYRWITKRSLSSSTSGQQVDKIVYSSSKSNQQIDKTASKAPRQPFAEISKKAIPLHRGDGLCRLFARWLISVDRVGAVG